MGTIWYYIPSGNQTWHWDITYKWRFWWENHRTKWWITIVTGYIPATKMTPTAPASTRRCRVLRMGNKQCITQHRYLLGIGSIILLVDMPYLSLKNVSRIYQKHSWQQILIEMAIPSLLLVDNLPIIRIRIWVWKVIFHHIRIPFHHVQSICPSFSINLSIIFPTP